MFFIAVEKWLKTEAIKMMLKRSKKYTVLSDSSHSTIVYPKADIYTDSIHLTTAGVLTIKAGFQCDGPTFIPDRKRVMLPSIIHDAIYSLIRLNAMDDYQEQADQCFRLLCIEAGVPRWRVAIYHAVLRRVGHRAILKKDGRRMFINDSLG